MPELEVGRYSVWFDKDWDGTGNSLWIVTGEGHSVCLKRSEFLSIAEFAQANWPKGHRRA